MLRQVADRACYSAQWGRGGTLCSIFTVVSNGLLPPSIIRFVLHWL